jgi:hypothetical protein
MHFLLLIKREKKAPGLNMNQRKANEKKLICEFGINTEISQPPLDNFLYKSISFPFKASQFSLANQN